jgi:uracil-DNA glycosylase family 4
VVRCAPPDNKPTPEEFRNCRPYLERELKLLREVRVVVALGKLAFDAYVRIEGLSRLTFGHDREHQLGPRMPVLISSYHPSQQNTSTGKLTAKMLRDVFERARRLAYS